jgi:hypothetical protein
MTNFDTIEKRIRWHAGLAEEPAGGGVSIAAWLDAPDRTESGLRRGMSDLLAAMTQLNVELNGAVPSESTAASDAVPRSIAYAIGEITRMLRDVAGSDSDHLSEISWAAWSVDTAWLAVLAGDIDDLQGHLANGATMRPPGSTIQISDDD